MKVQMKQMKGVHNPETGMGHWTLLSPSSIRINVFYHTYTSEKKLIIIQSQKLLGSLKELI